MKSYPFARGAAVALAIALLTGPVIVATEISVREDSSTMPMPLPHLESSIDPGFVVIAEDQSNDDAFVVIAEDRSNDTGFLIPSDNDVQIAPDDDLLVPMEELDPPTPAPATPVDWRGRIGP
ncbi:MAG: hypothetical protein M3412_04810 [Chloroflexota bacterium]|nr:hypothetical protein [Chloroflexota bacterium]